MQNAVLINEGLSLMLFGMGTVFLFLALLIIATKTMSFAVQFFAPLPQTSPPVPVGNDELQAAIAGALHHHRNRT